MGYGKYGYLTLFRHLPGVEVFDPPKVTNEIAKIGIKVSPEFVCYPFKIVIGEVINLRKKYGIKHFIYAIDKGPCRMGFYAPVQERIIHDLGYTDVEYLPQQQDSLFPETQWLYPFERLQELTGNKFKKFTVFKNVLRFMFKMKYIEEIVRLEGLIRCRELKRGDTTRTVNRLIRMLDNNEHLITLYQFSYVIKQEFKKIPIDRKKKPLRIVITGEIHVFLEHFVNLDMIKKLGEMGIEVHPTFHVYDWILHKMHLNERRRLLEMIGKAYFPVDVGGEAQWDLPAYMEAQRNGFDGFMILYPFTCMPETMVRAMIEGQNPDPFYLPAQYYSLDETTAYEGLRTRLESFAYLMSSNRRNNPKFQNKYVEPPEIAEIFDLKDNIGRKFKKFMKRLAKPAVTEMFLRRWRKIPTEKLTEYYLRPGDYVAKKPKQSPPSPVEVHGH